MERIFVVLLISLAGMMSASAQGEIRFTNFVPAANLDAPVFNVDGTRLEGKRFQAQLLGGPTPDSLELIGDSVSFLSGNTPSGQTRAGYFNGGTRFLSSVNPGETGFFKIVAWDTETGETFEEATVKGMSSGFSTLVGGPFPGLPAALTGLESFSLVPEPPPWAFALVGGLVLVSLSLARKRETNDYQTSPTSLIDQRT